MVIVLLAGAVLLPAQSFQSLNVLGLNGLFIPGFAYSGGRPTARLYDATIPWLSLGQYQDTLVLLQSGENTLQASGFSAEASARASWGLGGASAAVATAQSNAQTVSAERLIFRFRREAHSAQWIPCLPTGAGSANQPVYANRFEELRNLTNSTLAASQIAQEYGDAVATHAKGIKVFEIMLTCETRTVEERDAAYQCMAAEFSTTFGGISASGCSGSSSQVNTSQFLFELHQTVIAGDGSPLAPSVPSIMNVSQVSAWLPGFRTALDAWWADPNTKPALAELGLQSINTELPASISVQANPIASQLRSIFDTLVAQHLDHYLEVEEFKSRVLSLINVGPFFSPPMDPMIANVLSLYAGGLQTYLDDVRQVAFDALNANTQAGLNAVLNAVSLLQTPPLYRTIFAEIERGALGNPSAYIMAAESGLLDWRARVNVRWLRRKYPVPQDPAVALRQASTIIVGPEQDGSISLSPADLLWLPRDGIATALEVSGTTTTRLNGIGFLPNLQEITLIGNSDLTDLSAIANARHLETLHLEQNGSSAPLPLTFLRTNWRLRRLLLKGQPIEATTLSNLVGTYFLERLEFAEPDGHNGLASRHFFLDVIEELENVATQHRTYSLGTVGGAQYLSAIPVAEHADFTNEFYAVYGQTFGNHYHRGWGSWALNMPCEIEFESVYWPNAQYERTLVHTNFQQQVLPQPVYSVLPSPGNGLSPEFLSVLGRASLWN